MGRYLALLALAAILGGCLDGFMGMDCESVGTRLTMGFVASGAYEQSGLVASPSIMLQRFEAQPGFAQRTIVANGHQVVAEVNSVCLQLAPPLPPLGTPEVRVFRDPVLQDFALSVSWIEPPGVEDLQGRIEGFVAALFAVNASAATEITNRLLSAAQVEGSIRDSVDGSMVWRDRITATLRLSDPLRFHAWRQGVNDSQAFEREQVVVGGWTETSGNWSVSYAIDRTELTKPIGRQWHARLSVDASDQALWSHYVRPLPTPEQSQAAIDEFFLEAGLGPAPTLTVRAVEPRC